MANYEMEGHRFTLVLVKAGEENGKKLYKRAQFDLVRFNVDENPDAESEIVPVGWSDKGKLFEKVWKVDEMPFAGKMSFEG